MKEEVQTKTTVIATNTEIAHQILAATIVMAKTTRTAIATHKETATTAEDQVTKSAPAATGKQTNAKKLATTTTTKEEMGTQTQETTTHSPAYHHYASSPENQLTGTRTRVQHTT